MFVKLFLIKKMFTCDSNYLGKHPNKQKVTFNVQIKCFLF